MAEAPKAPAARTRIEPWTPQQLSEAMKPLKAFYEKVAKGLKTIPSNEEYEKKTKDLAAQLLAGIKKMMTDYDELYESTKTKRTAGLKPLLCDKKLTNFLGSHFNLKLPETALYGVMDLNRIVPRAISLYIKEKGLGEGQVFVLDDGLKHLFESPSVEIPERSYLQLAQERINEIRIDPNYTPSVSSAEIHIDRATGRINMNYSALKIIIPKFGVDYEITNPEIYTPPLEEFSKMLEQILNARKEAQKKPKKNQE